MQLEECSREVLVQLNIGEKTDDPELYKKVKQLLQQAEEGSKAANVLAGVRALKLEQLLQQDEVSSKAADALAGVHTAAHAQVLPNIDEYAPNDVVELGALLARKLPRLERLELCCLDLNFSSLILRALGPALPCLQELTMYGEGEELERCRASLVTGRTESRWSEAEVRAGKELGCVGVG
eukprot:1143857-Pelagomonas_calceolata.AAC.3